MPQSEFSRQKKADEKNAGVLLEVKKVKQSKSILEAIYNSLSVADLRKINKKIIEQYLEELIIAIHNIYELRQSSSHLSNYFRSPDALLHNIRDSRDNLFLIAHLFDSFSSRDIGAKTADFRQILRYERDCQKYLKDALEQFLI